MARVALISVHSCPLAPLGSKDTGGMSVYVRETARELGRRGIAVDIFTRTHARGLPRVVELGEGARLVHVAAGPEDFLDKSKVYSYLPQFQEGVEAFGREEALTYDLIHAHYWLSGAVGLGLRQQWDVPLVVMFHTLGEVKNRARRTEREPALRIETERRVVAAADGVIAASAEERGNLATLYGAAPEKVDIVPCGVDLALFQPREQGKARERLGLNGHSVVLYVGRIEPFKGIDILLHAVASMEGHSNVRVLVAGGDEHSAEELGRLAWLAADLGIAEQVSFLGTVDQKELPWYYSAADVCVVPSYHESFGLVALEALACGTPVVASRVGGLVSTVKDAETGYLISYVCPEPFAERLEILLGDESLRRQFGAAARPSVEQYAWSQVGGRLLAVYQRLAPGLVSASRQEAAARAPSGTVCPSGGSQA